MNFNILYEDNIMIVVYKPPGLACQTAKISEKDLYTEVRRYLSEKDRNEAKLWLIHRLDQPVKGIVVFAKNEKAANILTNQIQSGVMHKFYYAGLQGIFDEKQIGVEKELTNYLCKDSKNNKSIILSNDKGKNRAKSDKNVKKATLKYKIINSDIELNRSLVEIELITGRFHQIRAQMSGIEHPILLDEKYGYDINSDSSYTKDDDKGQIALCAAKLMLKHPLNNKDMTFKVLENQSITVDFLCKYE